MYKILILLFLCNVGVPDNYPPADPKGANGTKNYEGQYG